MGQSFSFPKGTVQLECHRCRDSTKSLAGTPPRQTESETGDFRIWHIRGAIDDQGKHSSIDTLPTIVFSNNIAPRTLSPENDGLEMMRVRMAWTMSYILVRRKQKRMRSVMWDAWDKGYNTPRSNPFDLFVPFGIIFIDLDVRYCIDN